MKIDGSMYDLDEEITLEKNIKHTVEIVVARLGDPQRGPAAGWPTPWRRLWASPAGWQRWRSSAGTP